MLSLVEMLNYRSSNTDDVSSKNSKSKDGRFCVRCETSKPDNNFSTVAGKICTECKTARTRERESKKKRKSKNAIVINEAWRLAWPHIQTKQ